MSRKDRIFAFNIIPITDSGYVNVYGRDITKRKRMEEAVQSSEERWRALVELAPDGIVTVDLKGFITTINDAFEKLTGFSREEIVGKHFTRIGTLRVSDIHRYVKVFASLVKGDVPPSFDFIFKRKDGSEGWAESQFRLIEIDGKKRELFAVVRDVSERKMIEQKTLKYQERLEALHRSSFRLSKHNHVDKIFVESMEIVKDVLGFRYLGIAMIKGDEIVFDNSVGAYQSGDFRIPLNQPSIVGRVFKTGKAELLSDTRLDPDYYYDQETDENEQRLSELAVPVVIDGRVIAVIDIESVELGAFDSNDQRLVEILANHIASAINRIYSQQRLEELREKQHDELVGGIQRVSSMVRHDLRGPLQTIMNATYLMEKNPETIAEMRTLINSSIKNANDIMEDWKNQGINEQLTQSDTGIQTLIENALETSLIPSNVKVSQNIESSILHLDRIKTRRVLDNLIRNAVEAMPEGGALSFKGRVDGDVYVLEVKDTGVGISEDDLSRVFTPFYSTKPDGMGLGLAFCKRTVEAHAGSIEVESEVGEGTKFTISIPRASM
jgi:PAS domain S-box-containing protein